MKKVVALAGFFLCVTTLAHSDQDPSYDSYYSQTPQAPSYSSSTAQSYSAPQAPSPRRAEIQETEPQPRTWEISPEIYHATYTEPGVMENTGMMYGLSGSYTYDREKWLLRAEMRGAWGSMDYTSASTGTASGFTDSLFEIRGLYGYKKKIEKNYVTAFLGLAYRYLNDDSSGKVSSTGARGYERESNYVYTPIGIEFLRPMNNGWWWGGALEYDLLWGGTQISHLGDALSRHPDVENDQDGGYGFRVSLKFKKPGERYDLLIEPFIRWWKIDDSSVSPTVYQGTLKGYYEPENETTEIGAKVGFIY